MNARKPAYIAIAVLILLYILLTFGVPIDNAALMRYSISESHAQALTFTIVLPLCIIWLVAVYGFVQLKCYAESIKDNQDGRAFNTIANGLGVIAFRMPISTIVTSFFGYLGRAHPNYNTVGLILNSYISVIVAVVGFSLIAIGTDRLLHIANIHLKRKANVIILGLAFVIMVMYTFLAIGTKTTSLNQTNNGLANLPGWLVISTIVVPYVFAWYRGMVATYSILYYQRKVPGILYRQALRSLAYGVGVIISGMILLQLIGTQSSRINKLNLAPLLITVYIILISIGLGFGLSAIGAKRLKKIEEV